MEPVYTLLILAGLIWIIAMPLLAMHRINRLRREVGDLRRLVHSLWHSAAVGTASPSVPPQPAAPPPLEPRLVVPAPPDLSDASPPRAATATAPSLPPQAPPPPPHTPPLLPPPLPAPKTSALSLEQFLGVKLFAWLGGLTLFLGIVYFVKYAFDQNLISPAMRIGAGYLIGGGLVAAGLTMRASTSYRVLAQTFTATGILTLYGVTFAANALFHFAAFGPLSTFAYMAAITAFAFVLAVALNAPVIAVLGMAGGFLTPLLLNTGENRPFGLFGYITLLDLGLLAVAARRQWHYLAICGAVGTALLQAGWFFAWFWKAGYSSGTGVWIPISVHLFFPALFCAATAAILRSPGGRLFGGIGGMILSAWSFAISLYFLGQEQLAGQPVLLYSFLFGINAVVLAQIWISPRLAAAQWVAALISFINLAIWGQRYLTQENLLPTLASYLIFGLMHTGFAAVAARQRPEVMAAQRQGKWLGPLALLLVIVPALGLPELTWPLWVAALLLDLMIILTAAVTLSIGPVLLALGITLAALGVWLFRLPQDASPWGFLFVLGGFALVFAAAGAALSARISHATHAPRKEGQAWLTPSQGLLPLCAAALPYVLLLMSVLRLRQPDPTPVFTLGLLLSIGFLSLMRLAKLPSLGLAALICMGLLEYTWFFEHEPASRTPTALAWFLGCSVLFAFYPWLWRKRLQDTALPWVVSACSWLVHYPLVDRLVGQAWPDFPLALLPASFAVPPLLSLFAISNAPAPAYAKTRLTQQAWFGGAALFFITLIFPVQFEREALTLGWALEGAALCWLFTRIPHWGLRGTGVVLLVISFCRLVFNNEILGYKEVATVPIWNSYLYLFGTAASAHLAATFWLAPPRNRAGGINVQVLTATLGTILLFWLVNIEIADYFTPVGGRMTIFAMRDSFARGMTYSITWALFALALLLAGFWLRSKGARYAGIALMGITLLKLFFLDLATIGSIYRIAALMVVAVIALGASFLYQRFYSRENRRKPDGD